MNSFAQRLRKLLLIFLILCCSGWTAAEVAQHLLRTHAEHLLADIRSIHVNHSTWSNVQPIMSKWSKFSVPKGTCTAQACTYQIDLVETLPIEFVGSPDPGAKNWFARLMDHIGLRSTAARAGFTINNGVVITKWFGEQVTIPIRDWEAPDGYVPYLSVASTETAKLTDHTADRTPLHPNRSALRVKTYLDIQFSPTEDDAEKAALMDFNLACITQFRPCESHGEILPEGQRLWQQQVFSTPSR
jgi:hypothetical protein